MKIISRSISIILIIAVALFSGCVEEETPVKVPETKIVDESLLISPGINNIKSYELKDAGTYRYEFTADKPVAIWLFRSSADFKLAKLGDGSARVYPDCCVLDRLASSKECTVDAGARLGIQRVELGDSVGSAKVNIKIFKK